MHNLEDFFGLFATICLLSHGLQIHWKNIQLVLATENKLSDRARSLARYIQYCRCDPMHQNWSPDGKTIRYSVVILQAITPPRKIIARVMVSKSLTTVTFRYPPEPTDAEELWISMISSELRVLGIQTSRPPWEARRNFKRAKRPKPQTPE